MSTKISKNKKLPTPQQTQFTKMHEEILYFSASITQSSKLTVQGIQRLLISETPNHEILRKKITQKHKQTTINYT